MDVKKHVLSEHLSPRRKVFSWLGWGLVASLTVITGLSLNNSFKTPAVASEFQGSYTNIVISSSSSSSISVSDANEELQKPVETEKKIETDNVPKIAEKQEFLEELEDEEFDLEDGVDIDAEGTLLDNSDEGAKNGNFGVEEEEEEEARIKLKAQQANGSVVPENEKLSNSEGEGVIREKTKFAEENVTTYKPVEGEFLDNVTTENNNVGNFSDNEKVVGLPVVEEKARESNVQETMAEENKTAKSPGVDTEIIEKPDGSLKNCDLFDGRWVKDGRYKPYYPPGSCPYVDKDFNCLHNGRPDNGYIKWKWQPNRCNLPRLNATDFLERLRGKRLVFVGDSLNRNMWESMVCILRRSIKKKKRVYEISGRSDFKKKGVYAFRFEDYNCTVDFVAAPFLVKESKFKRENGVIETLRLDLMDQTTSVYHDAELMVFNTGHWWTHEKTSKGEDYYQEGNHVYPQLKALNAFQKALTTWSRWVDNNINSSRTQVFFRGYSITHFWGGQWNSGGQCHQETEPIYNETYLTKYPSKMRSLENVLQNTKTPVIYMNISRLTDYRKDAHPSIYRREYKTEEERKAAVKVQDCSHWCLPGVPDTWNELFYASLLKAGKGVWKN